MLSCGEPGFDTTSISYARMISPPMTINAVALLAIIQLLDSGAGNPV